jgi:hypothetical protein
MPMSDKTVAPASEVKMLKAKINGVDVEVKAGTSIIEAFSQNNQSIAHYCWHPGLSVAGVCKSHVIPPSLKAWSLTMRLKKFARP